MKKNIIGYTAAVMAMSLGSHSNANASECSSLQSEYTQVLKSAGNEHLKNDPKKKMAADAKVSLTIIYKVEKSNCPNVQNLLKRQGFTKTMIHSVLHSQGIAIPNITSTSVERVNSLNEVALIDERTNLAKLCLSEIMARKPLIKGTDLSEAVHLDDEENPAKKAVGLPSLKLGEGDIVRYNGRLVVGGVSGICRFDTDAKTVEVSVDKQNIYSGLYASENIQVTTVKKFNRTPQAWLASPKCLQYESELIKDVCSDNPLAPAYFAQRENQATIDVAYGILDERITLNDPSEPMVKKGYRKQADWLLELKLKRLEFEYKVTGDKKVEKQMEQLLVSKMFK